MATRPALRRCSSASRCCCRKATVSDRLFASWWKNSRLRYRRFVLEACGLFGCVVCVGLYQTNCTLREILRFTRFLPTAVILCLVHQKNLQEIKQAEHAGFVGIGASGSRGPSTGWCCHALCSRSKVFGSFEGFAADWLWQNSTPCRAALVQRLESRPSMTIFDFLFFYSMSYQLRGTPPTPPPPPDFCNTMFSKAVPYPFVSCAQLLSL